VGNYLLGGEVGVLGVGGEVIGGARVFGSTVTALGGEMQY